MEKPHALLAVRSRINRHARMLLHAQRLGSGNGVPFAGGAHFRFIFAQPADQQRPLAGAQSRQPLLQGNGVCFRGGVYFTHIGRCLRFCSKTSLHVFKVASRVIALPSDPSSARNGNVRATGCRFGLFGSSKISCLEFCACDRMPHQKPGCDAFGSTLTLIQAGRPEVTARSKAGRSSLGSVIHSAWPPNTSMMRS